MNYSTLYSQAKIPFLLCNLFTNASSNCFSFCISIPTAAAGFLLYRRGMFKNFHVNVFNHPRRNVPYRSASNLFHQRRWWRLFTLYFANADIKHLTWLAAIDDWNPFRPGQSLMLLYPVTGGIGQSTIDSCLK